MTCVLNIFFNFIILILSCECQRDVGLPFTFNSFTQIVRTSVIVPSGRSLLLDDIIFRFYGTNTTDATSYKVRGVLNLLDDPNFDLKRPTVIYAHGYVELTSDDSVMTIIRAYISHGGYNIVVLDWANLAFGNYVRVVLDVAIVGRETGKALRMLLKRGLSLETLHLVGHSMGAHILGIASKALRSKGYNIPRLTGLDPAYPGFYPPLFVSSLSSADAKFVDVIHTDGGGYGVPSSVGHVDFWPNEGQAKQPGCPSATIPLTTDDFCSHWRSWALWAESLEGGEFQARLCTDYDTFLREECIDSQLVSMGIRTTSDLRGNFYLRTGTKSPYALGKRGAE